MLRISYTFNLTLTLNISELNLTAFGALLLHRIYLTLQTYS